MLVTSGVDGVGREGKESLPPDVHQYLLW